MTREKQKFINALFDASKKRDQKNLEKLIQQSSVLGDDPARAISHQDWLTAKQTYEKKIKRKKIIVNGLYGICLVFLLLVLAFLILYMLRRPSIEEIKKGDFEWVAAPTETIAPTPTLSPTFTPQPTFTPEPTPIVYDESKGWVDDSAAISPVIPLTDPQKVWIFDVVGYVQVSSEAVQTDPNTPTYFGQGESVLLAFKNAMNAGLYQICYLEPIEHANGEYTFSILADGNLLFPLSAGESKLDFGENQEKVEPSWNCLGYYDIPSTPDFSITVDILIEQEDFEFPLTQIMIIRLKDEEAELIRNLGITIPDQAEIVVIKDDEGIQSNSGKSTVQNTGYWGSGFSKLDGLELGSTYTVVFPGQTLLEPGEYQIAVHISADACKANESFWLTEFEAGKESFDLEKIPGSEMTVSSENCANQWIVGGQWVLEEKLPVVIRSEVTAATEGISAGFDAVAIIRNNTIVN